jgi:glycosyltransferase involved in cell wall biosynthesis
VGSPDFDVVCFGEDWYKSSYLSTRQIALRLARGRRLLWINPLPVRLPSLENRSERRAFWRKVLHKLKTHLRFLRREGDAVWVFSPLYMPFFLSERGDRVNAALLGVQVRLACRLLRLKPPLVLAASTYQPVLAVRGMRRHRFVYRFADKNSAFTDLPPERSDALRRRYERYDRLICEEADRVYCASRAILEDLESRCGKREKIAYLPHGVDVAHFAAAREGSLPVPPALRDLPKPVVGYFGSLTNHNDKEILQMILERHPDWSVVLIGRVVGDYSGLGRYPNLLLTGAVPYAELPAWAQVFDVGIMNWIETEWIESSFPVKAQEYLAMGIPVVSVRIRELREAFGDVVRIAAGREDFVRLVEEELADDDAAKRAARIERVRDRDWDRVAARILADAGAGP